MIRKKINDRYIKGTVAFESNGDTAIMSYIGQPNVPLNVQYEFENKKWKVVQVRTSNFNSQVVNVDLVIFEEN